MERKILTFHHAHKSLLKNVKNTEYRLLTSNVISFLMSALLLLLWYKRKGDKRQKRQMSLSTAYVRRGYPLEVKMMTKIFGLDDINHVANVAPLKDSLHINISLEKRFAADSLDISLYF